MPCVFPGGGWGLHLLPMILFWGLVILGLVLLFKGNRTKRHQGDKDSALEILKLRFATGEISREEYLAKREDLV